MDRGGPTSQLVQALNLGLMESLDDRLAGRQRSTWLVDSSAGPVGIGTLLVQGRRGPQRLELATDPDWMGQVEGALLDGLLSLATPCPGHRSRGGPARRRLPGRAAAGRLPPFAHVGSAGPGPLAAERIQTVCDIVARREPPGSRP